MRPHLAFVHTILSTVVLKHHYQSHPATKIHPIGSLRPTSAWPAMLLVVFGALWCLVFVCLRQRASYGLGFVTVPRSYGGNIHGQVLSFFCIPLAGKLPHQTSTERACCVWNSSSPHTPATFRCNRERNTKQKKTDVVIIVYLQRLFINQSRQSFWYINTTNYSSFWLWS